MTVRPCADMELVRGLFREYQAGVDAPECFASFDAELAGLPGEYAVILVAWASGADGYAEQPAGCVALRPMGDGWGEVKRLYVRPGFRGQSAGRELLEAAVAAARGLAYQGVRLDTLPTMTAAQSLYRRLGFVEVERYNAIPDSEARFFELSII